MKYVGIANSKFKEVLVQQWKKGVITKIPTEDLISGDCSRHLEITSIFGKMKKFDRDLFYDTEYYKYQRSNGKSRRVVIAKLRNFYKLFLSIRDKGYRYNLGYIKVTTDGARLDGSHRSSILYHLKVSTIKVVILTWTDFFSVRQLRRVKRHLVHQKKLFIGSNNAHTNS